jgi:secondary thiamine-phosphate synthase enzyme
MIYKISLRTNSRVEFQDITGKITETVKASGVTSGVCYVYVPHTTAAVMINEHADPSVAEDIAAQLDLMAPQHNKYLHREGNSPAHIKACLIGESKLIFIEDGRPALGEWQGIFFCEFDGPRPRTLLVKIVADK